MDDFVPRFDWGWHERECVRCGMRTLGATYMHDEEHLVLACTTCRADNGRMQPKKQPKEALR